MATSVRGDFEWDTDKAAANLEKHGVTFEEAATALQSTDTAEMADPIDATRIITLGFSAFANLLLVVSTEVHDGRIRVISARRATPAERRAFARR